MNITGMKTATMNVSQRLPELARSTAKWRRWYGANTSMTFNSLASLCRLSPYWSWIYALCLKENGCSR